MGADLIPIDCYILTPIQLMDAQSKFKRAGFWIRLLATWMDGVIIYLLLTAVFYLFVYAAPQLYFPFNFTFFVTGLVYAVTLTALNGQTIGKYLLNITVRDKDGSKLSFYKILLRETILKIISGVVLFLGFFWIGFSKNKMAWHDYIVRSTVVKNKKRLRFAHSWKIVALASLLFFSLNYLWTFFGLISEAKKMELNNAAVSLPFVNRNTVVLTDIATVKDTSFVNWLNNNDQSPEAYALQVAATHQVTLFGEMHENADNLNFFNQIIPKLYHQSGIRVIAMEVIPCSMNEKVEQLVNGKIYDSSLALEIARAQCWKSWGFKEYWNVLKTVWQLNQSLSGGVEKMRVIGLDTDWEMPNLALLGTSQDSKGKTGFWEKFRIFSAIKDFPKFSYRDQLMALNVEKEIINKHQKAVIWIGINHTLINFVPTIQKNNTTVAAGARFGYLLSQKYKNTFFQITLHQNLIFSDSDTACKYTITNFLDTVMNRRNNKPVGFTIAASPFEKLRDNCLSIFTKYPSLCYGDIAEGLIFLGPREKYNECTWLPGYISNEMFMKYKPMYDLMFGQKQELKFKNAAELNQILVKYLGKK